MNYPVRKLNDGVEIPLIGFGTFLIDDGAPVIEAVQLALEAGYPSIDTAAVYENEEGVGKAIRESGIDRKDIFVTTKLSPMNMGYEETLKDFDQSMKKLGLDYVDMYLVHWPGMNLYVDSWKAILKLREEGRIRTAGVSNFYGDHIDELIAATGVVPTVNQIEVHPYLFQPEAHAYCAEKDILIEAWSPLMKGQDVLTDPVIVEVAKKCGKTPAQTVLRWHIQHGYRILPKSVTPSRIKENIDLFDFEIAEDDMKKIDALQAKNVRTGPDPHAPEELYEDDDE